MRTFYIYNVNDYFCSVYDKYPYKLYKIFEDIYYTNKSNMMQASSMYEQVIVNYNKLFVNNYISANNRLDVYYFNRDNIHLITNNYEYSKLMVSSYCLKLKSNLNCPTFFNNINKYSDNIFICDFANRDYFWLRKVIVSDNLIKQ